MELTEEQKKQLLDFKKAFNNLLLKKDICEQDIMDMANLWVLPNECESDEDFIACKDFFNGLCLKDFTLFK